MRRARTTTWPSGSWTPPASAACCRIAANGEHVTDLELPIGATRGSREGDATVPGTALRRALLELPVPAAALQEGQNVIELELAEGGWVAWDALGLFARG